MLRTTLLKLRWPLLGACTAALTLAAATALAGSGVGGIFNLGVANTVNAQTTLSGNPAGSPLLRLTGSGTAATLRAAATSGVAVNGVSSSGTGQYGQSTSGHGLFGSHTGSSGTTSGVYGQTASTDPASAGITGRNMGGGPGLSAIVTGNSVAPLKVNSSAKVVSLNADQLDGLDSSGFVPASAVQRAGPLVVNPGSQPVLATIGQLTFSGVCMDSGSSQTIELTISSPVAHAAYASMTHADAGGDNFADSNMPPNDDRPLALFTPSSYPGAPFFAATGEAVSPDGHEVFFNLYMGQNAQGATGGQCVFGGSFVVK